VFDIKDLGKCTYFLGIRIICVINYNSTQISLCQDTYIYKVLDQFGMANSKPVSCPIEPGSVSNLVLFKGSVSEEDITQYQSLIGCINYLAIYTRPDISFSSSILLRFLVNPSPVYIKAARRVLQYLKGSIDLNISFDNIHDSELNIQLFSDADYTSDRYTYRSTSVYIGFFARGPAT
jgi:hypothetical protein